MDNKASITFGSIISRRTIVRDSFYGVFRVILKILNLLQVQWEAMKGICNWGELSDIYFLKYNFIVCVDNGLKGDKAG